MSSSGKIFLFILILPFFTAIGHDVYNSYFSDSDKRKKIERLQIEPDAFQISDAGWIWQNYHPKSMEQARKVIEPTIWKDRIDPVLQYPTFMIGLFPFLIGCIFCIFACILGVWPFTRIGSRLTNDKGRDYAVYKHAKSKSIKYSRK